MEIPMPDALTVIRHAERPTVAFVGGATYQPIIGDDNGAGVPIPHRHSDLPAGLSDAAALSPLYRGTDRARRPRRGVARERGGRCPARTRRLDRAAGEPAARVSGRRRRAARHLRYAPLRPAHRRLRRAAGRPGLTASLAGGAAAHSILLDTRETTRWPSAVSI